jgi:hypothetical protein
MSTPKREPDKKKERKKERKKKKKKNGVSVSHQRTSCEENEHIPMIIIMKLASSPVKAQ